MPRKTDYQKQADKRTRDALRLRARFDGRLRKYSGALLAALAGALDARNRINRINLLYGVDISTETLLAHEVRVSGLGDQLGTMLGNSTPGEEIQLFNLTIDGNSGAVLALEALFGEITPDLGTGPGSGVDTPPAPMYNTSLTGPDESASGVTLAASAGDVLRFNTLAEGGSAPSSMDVNVGGQQVASVAYLDRYNGKAFSFTTGGVTRTGSFAAVVNF
ncbi:hypothetical protein KBK19_16985 [Microvirga sp. STR05]|uniref:Uncharacterized protein n=1 Tax=Hymenobacter duratus TaxID=2771356 RepID=A0ABR8JLY4_9BACT|nr:hypothetical protein [Hymenobacter duratus]MBD2716743.1 hypothetical protein [Hymenobacter duratus]MBR7951658.1 hypothetical protein [Microvirga sp. STR05]